MEHVRYIKLGAGGEWWKRAKSQKLILHGGHFAEHRLALAGKWAQLERRIQKRCEAKYADARTVKQQIGSALSEYRTWHNPPAETVWITFEDGCLWWCDRFGKVELLNNEMHGQPKSRRTAIGGWRCRDKSGNFLRITELPGTITRTLGFRSTICEPRHSSDILRAIRGGRSPSVLRAQAAKGRLIDSILPLVTQLHWRDFEALVDLIFIRAGWPRVSRLGGTQKTIDLELEHPASGKRAMVQVKSSATQRDLERYARMAGASSYHELYFVYHSSSTALKSAKRSITVWDVRRVSEMIVNCGLVDWIVRRAI